MANEVTINIAATLVNGSLKRTFNPGAKLVSQTAAVQHGTTVALTTAISQLSVGSVTTLGYMMLTNVHASATIFVGPHSTTLVPFLTVKAGESQLFRLTAGTTVAARTESGSANLFYDIWSD